MKKVACFILLLLPVGILTTIAIFRQRTTYYQGMTVDVLLSQVSLSGTSAPLEALQKMGKGIVPELRLALEPGNDHSRRLRAAWVLGELGPEARDAVPDLMDV